MVYRTRFILAGFRPDLERLLPACDLAVSSSHTEGLPVVVLEEMAAGLAVVATAVGGTPEVVEDGATGWLVPPADPAALARRMMDLLAVAGIGAGDGISGTAARRDAFYLRGNGGGVFAFIPARRRAGSPKRPNLTQSLKATPGAYATRLAEVMRVPDHEVR